MIVVKRSIQGFIYVVRLVTASTLTNSKNTSLGALLIVFFYYLDENAFAGNSVPQV